MFRFVFILRNRLNRSRKLHERVIQLFEIREPQTNMRVCWSGLAASCTLPPWNQKFRCKKSWVSLDTWLLSLFPIRMFNSDPLQCTTLAIRATIFASRSLLTAFCASLTVWKAENVRNDGNDETMPPYRSRCKRSTANMTTHRTISTRRNETKNTTKYEMLCANVRHGWCCLIPSHSAFKMTWVPMLDLRRVFMLFWGFVLSLFVFDVLTFVFVFVFSCRFCCSKFENIAFPSSTPRCSRCCSAAASSSLASVILWTWLNSLRIWSLRIWKFKWKKWKSFKVRVIGDKVRRQRMIVMISDHFHWVPLKLIMIEWNI